MILKSVSIVNFKNHKSLKVNFSDHVNCFLGNNGVGKTNLLDSIYYLSFCKSYYNSIEFDNINYGQDFFMIKGDFIDKNQVDFMINGSLVNNKKSFKFNNKKYDKLSNHIGKVPLVITTPIDANIIVGGGEERRRFVNKFLSQIDKDYLLNLISYNRVLKQRNTLLKDSNNFNLNEDLMNAYDVKLSNFAKIIHQKRQDFISLILNNVQSYYDFISQKNESIDILYHSELNNYTLFDLLKKNREKDRFLKHTSSGVHRDDFVFKINEYSLKKSGSQGQQKTFLIALKFGYFDLLKSNLKITPLLLLDDIFDKLDNNRVEQIIRIINKNEFGQIFITDTSFNRIDSIMDKVNSVCKYFIFDKTGLYEEKFKK
ncbi:MAG: DNA replication and repair protein RecF [Flavobacteriales bacterium]|nr:DNA replication and repair protein RecF [Flavobacteriales bacterium]|tara:strand:- start:40331 stop:41443 length:1113 start_codon:yes stop_codon:yes gene_type:complete